MQRKSFFSYVDTALRMIYINLNIEKEEGREKILEFIDIAETSKVSKSYFLQQLVKSNLSSNKKAPHLFHHEFHHYWQSLYHPFLYFVNVIEYMNIIRFSDEFRHFEQETLSFDELHLTNASRTNLTYLTLEFTLVWKNEQLSISENNNDGEEDCPHGVFSLNDFIEDPTSIYEYKMMAETAGGEDYSNWCRNPSNNSYKKLFRFLETIVGSNNAFNILPMLVQLAFHTTEPVSGLCNAFNHWYHTHKLNDHLFTPTFNDYLDLKFALEVNYPKKDISLNGPLIISDMPTIYIDEGVINQLIKYNFSLGGSQLYYPLADHFIKFTAARRILPEIEGYLFDAKPNTRYLAEEFRPFAVHHFLLELNGRNSYVVIGDEFKNKMVFDGKMSFEVYLKELTKIVSVTQSLATDFQNVLPHNCHHSTCPYYEFNKCRKWTSIPKDHLTCSFPFWFGGFYGYRIDLQQQQYVKLSEEEIADYNREYIAKSNKGIEFDYLILPDEYVLTVSQQHIQEDPEGTKFRDFILFLCKKTGATKEEFFGRIMLEFYNYNEDRRELFEIPEVVEWMQKTKEKTPELLLLLNFSKETKERKSLFFPMFIPFKKTRIKEEFQIEFSSLQAELFWNNELTRLRQLTISENYDPENVILRITQLFS